MSMRRRRRLITVAGCAAAAALVVWLFLLGSPPPAIDYEAELRRLAMEGQSADPNAENGWPELVSIAQEAQGIIDAIEKRERDADEAARNLGQVPEMWMERLELTPGCSVALTARDERLHEEVIRSAGEAGLFDRLHALQDAPVFLCDIADRHSSLAGSSTSWSIASMRALAKVVAASLQRAAAHSEPAVAVARLQDMQLIAHAVGRQPFMFHWMIGVAIEALARDAVIEEIRRTEGAQSAVAQAALSQTPSSLSKYLDSALQGGRLEFLELLDGMAEQKRDSIGGMVELAIPAYGLDHRSAIRRIELAFNEARRLSAASLRAVHDASQEFKSSAPGLSAATSEELDSRILLVALVRLDQINRIDAAGAHIVMALALHTERHGSPPGSLDGLVPEFFEALPIDPLAPDGRFRYIPGLTLADVVVYSVGLDGEDNGGATHEGGRHAALYSTGAGYDFMIWPPGCDRNERARE